MSFSAPAAGLNGRSLSPFNTVNSHYDEGFRLDLLVQSSVVCEIKAVEKHNAVWEAQLLSYMKLTGCQLGFLINFNVPVIKNGIKRMIL